MALALKRKPEWLLRSGQVVARVPEPHYDVRYVGSPASGWEAESAAAYGDERLDALRASGVTLVSLPFYRGYGAEFESETMDRAADFAQRAHARDLRVAARVTVGAVTPETMLAEEPDAHNWLQVNADGQPCVLATPTPGVRVRPCYQSEGYLRYIEKVCLRAVEAGADLLVLQEVAYSAEPDTCRCPLCVSAFRERLREQYGPQAEETRVAGMERFGHHTFNHVRPPLYRSSQAGLPAQLTAPHEQEWQWFKTRTLARFLERLSKAAERQNAECAVAADVLRASESETRAAGIDLTGLLPLLDLAACPGCPEDGDGIGRSHAVRRAHAFGVTACLPHGADESIARRVETLALQPDGPLHADEAGQPLIEFLRQHRETLFSGARAQARIGVYCDTTSLMLNSEAPHAGLTAVERFLTNRHLPFALLAPGQLDDLSAYACVVVPDAECMDDEAAARLTGFAESGGGLLVTGAAGTCDAWRRPRATPLWADHFGGRDRGTARAAMGQGRAAYVPRTDDEPALAEALRFAMGEPELRVAVRGGRVRLTHYRLPSGAQTLHLVRPTDAQPAGLEFALNCGAPPQEVLLFVPGQEPRAVAFSFDPAAQQLSFCLDEVPDYAIVRIA